MNLKQYFEGLLIDRIEIAEKYIANYENFSFVIGTKENDFNYDSWMRESITLIDEILKKDNIYYINFYELFNLNRDIDTLKTAISILDDVKNIIRKQELLKAQILIETEIFNGFLEQSDYLLKKGMIIPSAVIVGCVMEDSLRKLMNRRGIKYTENERSMQIYNDRLSSNKLYNDVMKVKIDLVIKIRNHAAHSELDHLKHEDVFSAIEITKNFLNQYQEFFPVQGK